MRTRPFLTEFQHRISSGADLAKLAHAENAMTREGDKLLRYMKPIMVTEPWLVCHGTDGEQDVTAEIVRHSPEDKALGLKHGDLRGAFSPAQFIEE